MNPSDYLTKDEQSLDVTLTGRIQDISVEVTQLSARDQLTDLEERTVAALEAEFDALEKQQKKLHLDGRSRYIAKAATSGAHQVYSGDLDTDPLGEPASIEDRSFKDPWNLDEMRAYPFDSPGRLAELRARAKSAIELMPGTSDARRKTMTEFVERHDDDTGRISQLVLASSPDYMSFFGKRLRFGDAAILTEGENKAAQRAMSLTTTEGGFLIPFQLDPTVIITSDGSLNQIRRAARTVIATSNVWQGVSAGAVVFTWDAEAAAANDAAPTFAQPAIPVYKGVGFIPISIEALMDEQNVTAEIGRLLAFGKDVQDAAAFATGSGSAQPTGIVTALTGGASIVPSSTADAFLIADLYAVQAGLPARYRPNASWLANNAWYNLVRGFNVQGQWTEIGADRPALLMGKPAYESEDMDGVITAAADNYMAVFGDFSNYVIADRVGMTVETIQHLLDGSTPSVPTGQRGVYCYYRVGADSVNDGAFSMLNVT
jgi:HK97 family phage major capsid protein